MACAFYTTLYVTHTVKFMLTSLVTCLLTKSDHVSYLFLYGNTIIWTTTTVEQEMLASI